MDMNNVIKKIEKIFEDSENVHINEESLDESISDGALDRLIEAMILNPRANSMLGRYGIDLSKMEKLKSAIRPALKLFFRTSGVGVSGSVSDAKKSMRDMAKG